jgi:hypothetical protein
MKKNKHGRNLDAFFGQDIRILFSISFDQTMRFHLAKIVSQLSERVVGQLKGFNDPIVNGSGTPAIEAHAGMHEHFHQTDHAGVMDLDAGDGGVFA